MKHLHFVLLTFAIVICGFAFLGIKQLHASTAWKLYVSETELFTVMFPGNPDEKVSTFRIGDNLSVQNSEVLAFIDQRPYKDIVKTYVVKFDQTIGPAIPDENKTEMVQRELKLYADLYQDQKPNILDQSIDEDIGLVTGEMSLSYEDFEAGMQGVKIKVIITNTSKFHQVFTGPFKDLDSPVTNKYFKSFNTKTGYIPSKGTINEDWRRIESPLALFAVKIPPVSAPYFMKEPKVTKEPDNKVERMGMTFTDPIWAQNLFYNIVGYQLDTEMSFDLAEKALLEKHFKRHGRSMVGMKLHKDFIGETPYIETYYAVKSPKGYPYVNYARVRGMFLGNYMIVQEVVGPKHLVVSKFTENFFDLVEFTPKKAFQKEIQRHMDFSSSSQSRKAEQKPRPSPEE